MTLTPAAIPALRYLRDVIASMLFPLALEGAGEKAGAKLRLVTQFDDYLLPRLEALEAPLLAVICGSTGSGKSTLLNSLIDAPVALASAIRPTTRRPLLLHHPRDEVWFTGDRILGSLERVILDGAAPPSAASTDQAAHQTLEVRATTRLPEGLALLDTPDIDSVVRANRELAHTLMDAADLWLFVTTATRYADLVPWDMLWHAAERNVVAGIVLNRVAGVDAPLVSADLAKRMARAGLEAPLFTIAEVPLQGGRLPQATMVPLRTWLGNLAMDAGVRAAVAHQSVTGAIEAAISRGQELAAASGEHVRAKRHLAAALNEALVAAERRVTETAGSALLRGEVLRRWQDFARSGELDRNMESAIGKVRESLGAAFRDTASADFLEEAIYDSLPSVLLAEAKAAALDVQAAWQLAPGGAGLLDRAQRALMGELELSHLCLERVRAWQEDILAMIRAQGAAKLGGDRYLTLAVNALGVALMTDLLTGGFTGGEGDSAGGTAVAEQLEAVLGADAVRQLAQRARQHLALHTHDVLSTYLRPFERELEDVVLDPAIEPRMEAALAHVRVAEALA